MKLRHFILRHEITQLQEDKPLFQTDLCNVNLFIKVNKLFTSEKQDSQLTVANTNECEIYFRTFSQKKKQHKYSHFTLLIRAM